MDDVLTTIALDFPIMAILLFVLIGQQKMAGRIIDLLEAHLIKLIDVQEKIADGIAGKDLRS